MNDSTYILQNNYNQVQPDTNLNDLLDTISDSNAASINQKTKAPVASILHSKNEKGLTIQPNKLDFIGNDWIVWHLLISLVIIAWVNVFYNKRLKQTFKSFVSPRYQHIMTREGNLFKERISIALFISFIVNYSIFIYLGLTQFIKQDFFSLSGLKLYAIILLIFILLWIIKNIVITIVGITFKNPVILRNYLLTNFIFNVVSSILILPIIITALFVPSMEMLYIGAILVLSVFIYRLFREFFTAFNYNKFSWLNRILYLCTFEIAPMLIFIKLIMNNLG
ncbi:MAG: DUF4271 domain-containing protein [Bacteroidales bacterium]|nr:DUF4271 domain-containing protein [Bacteroidales bacterium]MCF8405293.1 DUF4271 domain-containing protein [Bacteroidales bacterium]